MLLFRQATYYPFQVMHFTKVLCKLFPLGLWMNRCCAITNSTGLPTTCLLETNLCDRNVCRLSFWKEEIVDKDYCLLGCEVHGVILDTALTAMCAFSVDVLCGSVPATGGVSLALIQLSQGHPPSTTEITQIKTWIEVCCGFLVLP